MLKRTFIILIGICLILGLLSPFFVIQPRPAEAQAPVEVVSQRTYSSKTYYIGNGDYRFEAYPGSIHYQDEQNNWQDIDESIKATSRSNWDYEVTKGHWHLLIRDDTTVALGKDGNWLGFRYEGLAYLDWETKEYAILDTRAEVEPQIYGNRIVWEDIFTGVDLEYIYTADRFKENLIISQQARNWLANNPPSSYGLNNATTYIGGYIKCDWQNAYPAEDKDGNSANLSDYEAIDSSILWKHPIKDYIINALPLGYAEHEDLSPGEWEKIRYRFYLHENGNHYLLFGSKVTELNQYPAGTITIDPSSTFYPDPSVEVSSVDGYCIETTDAPWATIRAAAGDSANDDSVTLFLTYWRCDGVADQWMDIYRGGLVFDVSGLPDGCTVIAPTTLSIKGKNKVDTPGDAPTLNIYSFAPASNTALVGGDFNSCGATAYCDTAITYANWDTADYNDWAFNATGIAAVQAASDGNTVVKLSTRDVVYDVGGTEPNYSSSGDECFMTGASADTAGTASDPKLVVTYAGSTPTVVTANATSVEETIATLEGNITAVGAGNATCRRFEYGIFNAFTDNTTEFGNYGTGNFSANVTGLNKGILYVVQASANNSAGWGYGDNVTLLTKPDEPNSLIDSDRGNSWINFTWNKGTGANITQVRYDTSGYPADNTSGTQAYYGTGTSVNITGLSNGQIYYARAWSIAREGTWTKYSDATVDDTDYTLPGDPTGLVSSNVTCSSFTANWTQGTGGDYSMLRYKTGSYPTSVSDGTQGYYDTSNTTTLSGLTHSTQYFVRIWARDSDSNYYSANYTQDTETTSATSAPTVTTSAATSITHNSAALNGNITDVDCQNATLRGFQYGSACDNLTDNTTEGGSFGTGAFSLPISSLSANVTYYFRALAENDGGIAYGACANFTTSATPPPVGLIAPTGFALTELSDNEINASWNSAANATGYLLLVSTVEYPNDPEGNYAIAYSGNATSVNLVGYNLDLGEWNFSLWSYNNPYSSNYATASIGGDNLATELGNMNDILQNAFMLLPLIALGGLAFWRKDPVVNILAGVVAFFTGLGWLSSYLVLSLSLMALGSYFWGITIMGLLRERD